MSLLVAEGFDELQAGRANILGGKEYWNGAVCTASSFSTTTSSTRFSYGRCTDFSNYEYVRWYLGAPKTEVYFCCEYYRFIGPSSGDAAPIRFLDESDNSQVRFGFTNSGDLKVYRGNTQIGSTVSAVFTVGRWYWLSMYVKVDSVAGRVQIYADGSLIFDFTGNTQSSSSLYITDVIMDQGTVAAANYDDVFIMDSAGSSFKGHLLIPHRLALLQPTAAGTDTDFTASAGSPYQCVDDATFNDDTDYIQGSTPGHKSSFVLQDLPASALTVEGIFISSRERRTDSIPREVRFYVRDGGNTTPDAANHIPRTSYGAKTGDLLLINPATSLAYTPAEVNALQAGIELMV